MTVGQGRQRLRGRGRDQQVRVNGARPDRLPWTGTFVTGHKIEKLKARRVQAAAARSENDRKSRRPPFVSQQVHSSTSSTRPGTLGVLDTLDLVTIPKSVQPSTERQVWVDRHLTACLKVAGRDPWLIGPEMARTVHKTVFGGVAVHSGWMRGCTRSTMSAAGDGEEAWGDGGQGVFQRREIDAWKPHGRRLEACQGWVGGGR